MVSEKMLSLRKIKMMPIHHQPLGDKANLHTSFVLERRMGKRQRTVPLWKQENFAKGPWWKKPDIIMTAPIAKTFHPTNQETT